MKIYKLLRIIVDYRTGVHVLCTDMDVLNWIAGQVKIQAPSCDMEAYASLPSGEFFGMEISRLQDDAYAIGWWIMKQLCLTGWEPFSVEGSPIHAFLFRLESSG